MRPHSARMTSDQSQPASPVPPASPPPVPLAAALAFLRDGDGKFSTMRMIVFLIVAVFAAEHLFLTLKTGAMPPIDTGQIAVLIGAIAGKVAQTHVEAMNAPDSPNPKN